MIEIKFMSNVKEERNSCTDGIPGAYAGVAETALLIDYVRFQLFQCSPKIANVKKNGSFTNSGITAYPNESVR
jgi:hypothetical protein